MFWQNTKKLMEKIEAMEQSNIVLYLDKIVYPDTVKPIIERLKMQTPQNCEMKFVAITPLDSEGFKHKDNI